MAKNRTSWQPGQSGNPKGGPPKKRALTEILQKFGEKKIDGTKVAPKDLLASILWHAAVTGTLQFSQDQEPKVLPSDEWFDIAKFLYQHIDGAPKHDVDITSGGEKITFELSFQPGED